MPEAGTYLLTHVGFSKSEEPTLLLRKDDKLISFQPLGNTLTLSFDKSQRYCTGWYDMRKSESYPCPDNTIIGEKYEQCPTCQQRTGFNPAFYHATSVSTQQEERNLEPHFLYLAHFADGLVKVGISHAARGRARLLEQGARSALVLETFPTAHIARQYEAEIAALPNIAETLLLRKKISALSSTYTIEQAVQELDSVRQKIETTLGKTFSQNDLHHLDTLFFPSTQPDFTDAYETSHLDMISGKATGMLGCLLFCVQQDTPVFLPLKKYTGYPVMLSDSETPISLPVRQISLF